MPTPSFGFTNPKTLSVAERRAVAHAVAEHLPEVYRPESSIEQRSFELLPPRTFGSLDASSTPAEIAEAPLRDLPQTLRLGSYAPTAPLVQAVASALRKSGVVVNVGELKDDFNNFDLVLIGQGMNADYPEIEFYLSLASPWAFMQATSSERAAILSAIHTEDQDARVKFIRKLGRELLTEGRVIPLYVRSYVHLYRKGRLDVSRMTAYDGDVPFWKMGAR